MVSAVDPLAASALWPDPVTGLTRLFIFAVWTIALVMAVRMIRRGMRTRRRWRQLREVGLAGVATVVGTRDEVHYEDDEGRQWRTSIPTLRFPTAAGQVVTVEGPAQSGPGLAPGTTVAIRYNPHDPAQVDLAHAGAQADNGNRMLFGGVFVLAFAIALLVGVPIVIMGAYQP